MAKTYAEKLQDPRWQKKRLEILERDNWTCQSCLDDGETLHVHHKVYDNDFSNPWEYPSENLITLCKACHEREGENINQACEQLLQAIKSKFLSDQIKEIADAFARYDHPHANEVSASAIAFSLRSPTARREVLARFLSVLELVSGVEQCPACGHKKTIEVCKQCGYDFVEDVKQRGSFQTLTSTESE